MSEIDELMNGLDMGQVDAHTFATIVTHATVDQMKTIFGQAEWRTRVLDEIFRRIGGHLRADRASHVTAVVHWRLTGGAEPDGHDRYETVIEHGTCAVNREWTRDPRVTITLSPVDFVRLITQNASAPMLFVTGKVKVKGDLGFAAGLTGLFDLPRA
jgi:putative sterol carrier protein